MMHFADRLLTAVRSRGTPLCVGLDPRWESLPQALRRKHSPNSLDRVGEAFEEFCLRVLDIVAPLVAVVKPQSAFFESCGPRGMLALQKVLARARSLGLVTILDSKRNDIASTASAYADAALDGMLIDGRRFPV
jgi:orotidine-5'-phosphate decarboxylase